jgi:hypothetical protein
MSSNLERSALPAGWFGCAGVVISIPLILLARFVASATEFLFHTKSVARSHVAS